MPTYATTSGSIVVVAAEDDRFDGALRRATDLAVKRGEPLILYDWDAPSLLSEPMPTWWSSEGWDHQFPARLEPEQLDELGRAPIAKQVREARETGIDAFGWLPSDHGPRGLADYACEQRASIVVVPKDLTELHGLDALINGTARPAEELEAAVTAAVVIV
ncbi:MAG TPA: hypothetical protein VGM28_11290 [Candidatus Limnocylindrales bacterium]|jgi:hypothetical protein